MAGLISCVRALGAQEITDAMALQSKMRQLESGHDAVAWVKSLPASKREQTAGTLLDLLGGVLSDRKTEPKRKVGIYLENIVAAYATVAESGPLHAMVARLVASNDTAITSRVMTGLAECGSQEALAVLGDWARPFIEKLPAIIPDPSTDAKALRKLDDALQPLAAAIYQLSHQASPEEWKLRTELLTALVAKYEGVNHGKKTVARLKEELARTPGSADAAETALPEEMLENEKGEANFLAIQPAVLIPRTDSQLHQMDFADLKLLLRHTRMDGRAYPMIALHELVRRKDREGMDYLIAWAAKAEANLPDVLPPIEELQKVQQRHGKLLPQDRWVVDLSNVAFALLYLPQCALPGGTEAADRIMADFKRRWGTSDSGRTFAGLLEQQVEMGRQMLQHGQAPWQDERGAGLGEEE